MFIKFVDWLTPLPCLGSRQAARAAGRPGGRPAARPNTRVSLPCLGSQQAARAAARAGLPLPFTLCRYCVRVDFAPVKSGYDKVHNSMISTLRMKAILAWYFGPLFRATDLVIQIL